MWHLEILTPAEEEYLNGGFKSGKERYDADTKLYQCVSCDYKTPQKTRLDLHIKAIHLKIKDLLCPKCDYRTAIKVALQQHISSIHDKAKKYQCPQCDHKASQKGNLAKHFKCVHAQIKDFFCPQCEYKTSFKQQLGKHCMNVHKFNINASGVSYQVPLDKAISANALMKKEEEEKSAAYNASQQMQPKINAATDNTVFMMESQPYGNTNQNISYTGENMAHKYMINSMMQVTAQMGSNSRSMFFDTNGIPFANNTNVPNLYTQGSTYIGNQSASSFPSDNNVGYPQHDQVKMKPN
jgi:hypothetical protein